MDTKMDQGLAERLKRQALQPPSVTLPKLKAVFETGGRDLKPRTRDDWDKLLQHAVAGTALKEILQSGVADGFLVEEKTGSSRSSTWCFVEFAHLVFLNTATSAADTMPLWIARHGDIYSVNYEYEWSHYNEKDLLEKYHVHHCPQAGLRAATFLEEKSIAEAARAGDVERYRQLLKAEAYRPRKRGVRVESPESENEPQYEPQREPQVTTTRVIPSVVPSTPPVIHNYYIRIGPQDRPELST